MSKLTSHSPEFLAMLESLSVISKQMLLVSDGEHINVRQMSDKETTMLHLTTPSTALPFVGQNGCWAIKDYPEFYSIYKAVKDDPIINEVQNGVVVEVQNKTQRFTYRLSSPNRIQGVWSVVDEPNWVVEVPFDKAIIDAFRVGMGLIGAERVRVSVTSRDLNKMIFTALPPDGENIWEYTFHLETPSAEEFSYSLPTDFFRMIPKLDYTMYVSDDDMVKIGTKISDMDLIIYGNAIIDKEVNNGGM